MLGAVVYHAYGETVLLALGLVLSALAVHGRAQAWHLDKCFAVRGFVGVVRLAGHLVTDWVSLAVRKWPANRTTPTKPRTAKQNKAPKKGASSQVIAGY